MIEKEVEDYIAHVSKELKPHLNKVILTFKCMDELGLWDFALQDEPDDKSKSELRAKIIVEELVKAGMEFKLKEPKKGKL